MIIIHKDVLDTIKSNYIKRIKEGTISTAEVLEMYETLTQINEDRLQMIGNLERDVREVKTSLEAVTLEHGNMARESSYMRQYLTEKGLLPGYFEFKISKACDAAKSLGWKGE